MDVIGLTGGVGSGKTEAAQMLQRLSGAELLLADRLGHLAMEKGSDGYQRILEVFGREILTPDAQIERKKLAEIVFQEPEKLEQLNRIIHPIVLGHIQKAIQTGKETKRLLIIESAIMFESGCDSFCDEVWYVFVPKEIRIQRLQESRGYSREKSLAVIKQQMEEEEYQERCQRTIVNDGTLKDLEDKIRAMVQQYF